MDAAFEARRRPILCAAAVVVALWLLDAILTILVFLRAGFVWIVALDAPVEAATKRGATPPLVFLVTGAAFGIRGALISTPFAAFCGEFCGRHRASVQVLEGATTRMVQGPVQAREEP